MKQISLFEPTQPEPVPPPVPAARSGGLRWYQQEAQDAVHRELREVDSTLAVMATGLGKTRLGAALADRHDGSTLWLANREELVEQAKETLELVTGEEVGVEMGEQRSVRGDRIVVGSVQSFNPARLERLGRDRFSLVILDEAHVHLAPTYYRAAQFFSGAKRVGLTATPDRGDRKALAKLFDSVTYRMDILDGIDQGYLVPIDAQRVTCPKLDLSGVTKSAGDLAAAQLDERIIRAVGEVTEGILRKAPPGQGIAFFPGVNSATLAAERLNAEHPGSAFVVHSGTPPGERRDMVQAFKRGEYRWFCNVQIATLGFDAPAVTHVVLARHTLSRSLLAQMCGRGTRPLPRTVDHILGREGAAARRASIAASAKPKVTLLDFWGFHGKLSLATPEDILGGDYTEPEVKRAKKIREEEGGGDLLAHLERARAELKAIAASIQVQAEVVTESFDPFSCLHMKPPEDTPGYGYRPATPGQRQALKNMGVRAEDLTGMSSRAAQKLIGTGILRRQKGLASLGQLRDLKRAGVDSPNISFQRAAAMLGYIDSCYGRPDPARIKEMLK